MVKEQNRVKTLVLDFLSTSFFLFVVILFAILRPPSLSLSNLSILVFYLSSPGAISSPSAQSFDPLPINNGFCKRITN